MQMILVNEDEKERGLVEEQLIIALRLLTNFESICTFILAFLIAYIGVFFAFSFELVVTSCWFSHELVK